MSTFNTAFGQLPKPEDQYGAPKPAQRQRGGMQASRPRTFADLRKNGEARPAPQQGLASWFGGPQGQAQAGARGMLRGPDMSPQMQQARQQRAAAGPQAPAGDMGAALTAAMGQQAPQATPMTQMVAQALQQPLPQGVVAAPPPAANVAAEPAPAPAPAAQPQAGAVSAPRVGAQVQAEPPLTQTPAPETFAPPPATQTPSTTQQNQPALDFSSPAAALGMGTYSIQELQQGAPPEVLARFAERAQNNYRVGEDLLVFAMANAMRITGQPLRLQDGSLNPQVLAAMNTVVSRPEWQDFETKLEAAYTAMWKQGFAAPSDPNFYQAVANMDIGYAKDMLERRDVSNQAGERWNELRQGWSDANQIMYGDPDAVLNYWNMGGIGTQDLTRLMGEIKTMFWDPNTRADAQYALSLLELGSQGDVEAQDAFSAWMQERGLAGGPSGRGAYFYGVDAQGRTIARPYTAEELRQDFGMNNDQIAQYNAQMGGWTGSFVPTPGGSPVWDTRNGSRPPSAPEQGFGPLTGGGTSGAGGGVGGGAPGSGLPNNFPSGAPPGGAPGVGGAPAAGGAPGAGGAAPGAGQPWAENFMGLLEQMLQSPSGYQTGDFERIRDAARANLEAEFGGQRQMLDEEMARRGIFSSSIAAGRLGDLSGQQARAMATMETDLLRSMAETLGRDRSLAAQAGLDYMRVLQNDEQFQQDIQLRTYQIMEENRLRGISLTLEQARDLAQQEQFSKKLNQDWAIASMEAQLREKLGMSQIEIDKLRLNNENFWNNQNWMLKLAEIIGQGNLTPEQLAALGLPTAGGNRGGGGGTGGGGTGGSTGGGTPQGRAGGTTGSGAVGGPIAGIAPPAPASWGKPGPGEPTTRTWAGYTYTYNPLTETWSTF